jgi:hypothetical protein
MSLAVKGRITKVLSIETGTSKAGKEWKKQSFVLDTGAQYNPEVCFSLFGDEKVDMLRNYGEGQEVEVAFNVSSREFNGKYYHNLDAWKVFKSESKEIPQMEGTLKSLDNLNISDTENDDLPF